MPVGALIVGVVGLPLVAVVASVLMSRRAAQAVSVAVACVCLILSVALTVALSTSGAGRRIDVVGVLRADALSVVFVLATAFLYAATTAYSVGYLAAEARLAKEVDGAEAEDFARYTRRFYVGLNVFAWSMLCAPLVNGLALLWVAVEITTVVSALLVAIDDTEGATEAAWKYVLIASSGLGIALLATITMYYAGAQSLGQSYDLAFDPLLAAAHQLPQTPVRLAYVLAVVGFGTKVGLFPVHTWLPDAHAEAPTPVSALLSGSLLAVSLYAILRFHQVAVATLGPTFPQRVLLVFGALSLLLAALYVLDQEDVKRLLAYSSVEHMGILAIGISFGTPVAMVGVLLHVIGHAVAKGNAFMGAGVIMRACGTKNLRRLRGVVDRLPWSGPLFLVAVLALSGFPPFALFRSEFLIVVGGLRDASHIGAVLLVLLVTLAFGGVGLATTRILLLPEDLARQSSKGDSGAGVSAPTPALGSSNLVEVADDVVGRVVQVEEDGVEPSAWMVGPPIVGVVVLLVLGLHPPAGLMTVLHNGATLLLGGVR
jgi:hydrogenase-4 component F